ncbi:MAG TPA: hypothetical protein VF584_06615 [Longimicrobium sp.]
MATAPVRPLSLPYLAWAAVLGGVTTLLTRRLSAVWRSFWSTLVVVGVLDEIAEYYYAAEFGSEAPFPNAGAIQAIVVGCTTFILGSLVVEAVLGRTAQPGIVPDVQPASSPVGSATLHPEVPALIADLTRLRELIRGDVSLELNDELARAERELRNSDTHGLQRILECYGGIGSLTDGTFSPNADALCSRVYERALQLQRGVER